jgi:two-component system cell cycle sensor histidine kinase/response regulator CckA
MSVLLLEDDDITRVMLETILRGVGLDVTPVSDGNEVLDLLEQGRTFELLLTDIQLPGHFDGWSMAVEVRRRIPEIPVVYMTATHQQAIPVARSVYLRKPMKPKLLVSVIGALLGRRLTSMPDLRQKSPASIGRSNYLH